VTLKLQCLKLTNLSFPESKILPQLDTEVQLVIVHRPDYIKTVKKHKQAVKSTVSRKVSVAKLRDNFLQLFFSGFTQKWNHRGRGIGEM
jgi:hypothetical protein